MSIKEFNSRYRGKFKFECIDGFTLSRGRVEYIFMLYRYCPKVMGYYPVTMSDPYLIVQSELDEVPSRWIEAVENLTLTKKGNTVLVKHLRDENRVPFATVVAVDAGRIGVAVCRESDRFNKEMGRRIATGRAHADSVIVVPNRKSCSTILTEIRKMVSRSERYFKKEVAV